VEALFVGVFLAILVRPERSVTVVETSSSSPDVHKGGSS
jgi:hypothetical protein